MVPKFLLLVVALLTVTACTPVTVPTGQQTTSPLDAPAPTAPDGPEADAAQFPSPDAQWTAVVEEGGLNLVGATGEAQEIFPADSTITSVTWSPDSSRLLVLQSNLAQNTPAGTGFETTGPLTIWSVAVDDLTPTQLAELPDSAEYPSQLQWGEWSPDGNNVTFWSGPLGASILADGLPLSVLDSTTGEITAVGDNASLVTTDYHDWSPDSSRLVVTLGAGRDAWRNKSLAIFDVAEGTTTSVDAAADHIPGWVAWSPDGSLIAYAANPAETSDLEPGTINFDNPGIAARRIYLLDADTGESRLLNDVDSFQDAPVWSADGTTLYYVQRMDDQLQLMAADPTTGDATPVEGASEPLPDLAGYYGKFDWSGLLQQVPD